METEFSAFLGREEQSGNKRNGYRERTYALKGVGAISLRVPRDRHSKFDSCVIPKNEVIDPRLKEDFAVLSLAGISMRSLGMISRRILGLEVGKDTIAASYGLIEDAALKCKYWALYIDGTNFRVQRRGSTEREPTLVVLGVGDDDCRSILAVEPGHKENVDCWRTVFKSLKSRGLDAGAVKIGIMDGLPGLGKAFQEEFPNAVTARCWVHAKRNAVNKCPARLRDIFKMMVSAVMYADSQQRAREAFGELKSKMGEDGKRAVHCLEKDLEALLIHYTFDRKYWRSLKITNPGHTGNPGNSGNPRYTDADCAAKYPAATRCCAYRFCCTRRPFKASADGSRCVSAGEQSGPDCDVCARNPKPAPYSFYCTGSQHACN